MPPRTTATIGAIEICSVPAHGRQGLHRPVRSRAHISTHALRKYRVRMHRCRGGVAKRNQQRCDQRQNKPGGGLDCKLCWATRPSSAAVLRSVQIEGIASEPVHVAPPAAAVVLLIVMSTLARQGGTRIESDQ